MSASQNIKAARELLGAESSDDFGTAFRTYAHPCFTFVVSSLDNDRLRSILPWAGHEHKGREGFERLMNLLLSEFEPLAFEALRFTDAGDQVFVEGHSRYRHRETAKIADGDFLIRFDMRDGMIAKGQIYENTAAFADARRGI